jgi:hypothetical protein
MIGSSLTKEIRSDQGRGKVTSPGAFSTRTGKPFKKRKFKITDEEGRDIEFELDATTPVFGEPISGGRRCEANRFAPRQS